MPTEVIVIGLLALAGFLVGGVYSTWKTAKLVAIVLALLALLAAGGAITWLVSS
ncbi:hypothetical protein EV191_111177 [Tamaricihabitans halophyticus]|uniref:Major facilitator superfamily (MFS) profile domain-containing protein n=1 Tax=Tamaricihabitans halophyticus TaxID=1262583 RepID=A0A4R2QFQ1_9PSEU|nr:hypothetical protein [Tamaricihabitans halophyticus]TCP47972.1 hypothetical protein EV191_111177 [Tamaricihabitans halophyticus]